MPDHAGPEGPAYIRLHPPTSGPTSPFGLHRHSAYIAIRPTSPSGLHRHPAYIGYTSGLHRLHQGHRRRCVTSL